jgi:hypothetical protein
MKVNHYLYPHPVLGIGDDFIKKPSVSRVISYDDNNQEILFNYKVADLSDDYISLLKFEKTALICEINCSYTFYRKVFSSFESQLSFKIPDQDLKNKVDIQLILIATRDLENFSSPNFSTDLRGQTFQIETGDVLGVLDTTTLDIDAAGLAVSDFVKISENSIDDQTRYEFDQNALIIKLPKAQIEKLKVLKNNPNLENILISTLISPALIHALHNLKEENEESFQERAWFRALKEKSEAILGIPYPNDPADIALLVDGILQKPYSRLFADLEKVNL